MTDGQQDNPQKTTADSQASRRNSGHGFGSFILLGVVLFVGAVGFNVSNRLTTGFDVRDAPPSSGIGASPAFVGARKGIDQVYENTGIHAASDKVIEILMGTGKAPTGFTPARVACTSPSNAEIRDLCASMSSEERERAYINDSVLAPVKVAK